MGKYLAIKTANFSSVAVNQVTPSPIVQEVELTPTTTALGVSLNLSGEVITGEYSSDWKVYYVPIVSGSTYHLQIEWANGHLMRIGTSSVIPTPGTIINLIVNDNTDIYPTGRTSIDFTYDSLVNGYLCW